MFILACAGWVASVKPLTQRCSAMKSPKGREFLREFAGKTGGHKIVGAIVTAFCDGVHMVERSCKARELFSTMAAFVVVALVNFYSVLSHIVKIGLCFGRGNGRFFDEVSARRFPANLDLFRQQHSI